MNANDKSRGSGVGSRESNTVFVLICLHLLIVLPLAYVLNIWADEASTLYTTEHGLFQTFQNVFADEKQAPLYFWLLSLWREINHSIFFARIFSIVCSVLAIKFFYDLARKLFDEKAAIFITTFFALHPFLIWASLEIRVYSLVVLLSVLLLKLFLDGYLSEENISREGVKAPRKMPIFYVLTAIIALYTNYYLGFLLIGCFAALVVMRKQKKARQFFLQMLFVGLAILPLMWEIKQQFAINTAGFQPDKSIVEGLRIFWNHFLTFIFPTELFPPDEQTWVSFLRVWVVRFGIIAVIFLLAKSFYKIRQIVRPDQQNDRAIRFSLINYDRKMLLFGVIAGTVGAFLIAAYFLLGAKFVEIRHATVLFVPLVLFVFTVLINILPRRSWIFLALIFAFLYPYSIYNLYPNATKRGDWSRVAVFIEQNEKPNQPIIVFTAFDALALPYYYKGANKILPDEKLFDWEIEADKETKLSWKKQTEFIISGIPPAAPEVWLLTNEKCDVRSACEPLENFVEAHYTVIEERDFFKEKVRLLRKKND
ncbi:MAG: glycosyltransferase family 39 protein [Actinomycetota bacterium]